jgi:hypothetical protein
VSFTDGKAWAVTAEDMKRRWGGSGLVCGFCGHRFALGDRARWQYTNDTPGAGGNPFVCEGCDGDPVELRERFRLKRAAIRQHLRDPKNAHALRMEGIEPHEAWRPEKTTEGQK